MKKITLLMLLLAIGAGVYAQTAKPKMDRTELPKPLVAQLKLSPDQQNKVTAILKTKNMQIDSVIKRSKMGRTKRSEALVTTADTHANDQLYALFNQDQKLVYAQWMLKHNGKMGPSKAPAAAIAKN